MLVHEGPVSRIVVIGDVHGDLSKAAQCCRVAGLTDSRGNWRSDVPARTVVVQVGDQIDGAPRLRSSTRPSGVPRYGGGGGPDANGHDCKEAILGDVRVLSFFDDLGRQAEAAGRGCAVYSLLGNHEMNNVDGNTDYADVCDECKAARAEYFRRGGEFAGYLGSSRSICLKAGGVLFCHAGVCPRHLPVLDRLGEATSAYLGGVCSAAQIRMVRSHVTGPDGVLCHRGYSPDAESRQRPVTDGQVNQVLLATGCNAMVVGHNAHEKNEGISSLHGGRVWVVDPGMSSSIFGARAAVLEMNVAESGELTIRTLRAR